jgi:HAD superfamily hydrolase (TIGR01509 family)
MTSLSVRLIIFDLDGVLVDSRELHYQALNRALAKIDERYVINKEEHLARYDGNPTSVKLNLLTSEKGLPKELHTKVWELKQEFTIDIINESYEFDERIRNILQNLKGKGYKLYCASNSIYSTVKQMLVKKGFIDYFDFFISNEDVKHPKPSPEIYLRCCIHANVSPKEVIILEDSHVGRRAAILSACHLLPIADPDDVTLEKILKTITDVNQAQAETYVESNIKWNQRINVLIPMAGSARTFQTSVFPKFLTEIKGKPLIQIVVENLSIDAKFIFIVPRKDYEKYNLQLVLNLIAPNCSVVIADKPTEGAAISALLAKSEIDSDIPLLISNCDQYVEWNSSHFLYSMTSGHVDGGILTFNSTHPRYSFIKMDAHGWVTEVEEKKPISNIATAGIYFWNKGSEFVKYAEQMISKNIRVNDEFFIAPVYNQAIADGKKIRNYKAQKMWPLGIPEDLHLFAATFFDKI